MKRLGILAAVVLGCVMVVGCSKDNDNADVSPPDGIDSTGIFKVRYTRYKYMGNGIVHVNQLIYADHKGGYIDSIRIPSRVPGGYGYKTFRVTAVDLSDGDPRYSTPDIIYYGDVSYTCPKVILSEGIDSIINFYPTLCICPRGGQPAKLKDLWLPKSLKYIGPNPFFEKYRDRAGNHYWEWSYYLLPSPYADGLRIHVPDLEAWCAVEIDDTYLPPHTDAWWVGDIFPQHTLCIGNDSVSDLVIPASVEKIGPRVFAGASIKSVRMHDGIKGIGNFAFSKCTYLESAELSAGLEEISPFAFSQCRSLHHINIPKGVKRVGKGAFFYSSLRTLELPIGLETIGNKGFVSNAFKELTIPGNIKTVEDSAFYSNNPLTKLTLLSGKTKYGYGRFPVATISRK